MLEISNRSGKEIPVAGVMLKAGASVRLDIPYSSVRNAERNGFVVVRVVTEEEQPAVYSAAANKPNNTNVISNSGDKPQVRRRRSNKK